MNKLILPSAINVLTALNEEVVLRRKLSITPVLSLPKLRTRAWIVVTETSPMVITLLDMPEVP
jgi:hypothetical protein